VKVTRWEMEAA